MITLWNVILGVGVMLWAFGLKQMKTLIPHPGRRSNRRERPAEP